MADGIEIRGGASEFEAAVIAVVLDRINQDEKAAKERSKSSQILPAWVRAMREDKPFHPLETNGPAWIDTRSSPVA